MNARWSPRYRSIVDDGTVYVEGSGQRIEVGDVETVIDVIGGHSWTVTYSDRDRRDPDLDTSDEGLTIDVIDTIHAMTFDEPFVEMLASQPAEPPTGEVDAVSPRLGLFVGRLVENLEYGVR